MARDPADQQLEQMCSAYFVKRAADMGAISTDQLSDDEYRVIANEAIRANLGTFHNWALAAEGVGLDPSVNPDFAQKMADAGRTNRDAADFAAGLYPDLPRAEAVKRYQRDIARAAGQNVPEPREPNYGSPF